MDFAMVSDKSSTCPICLSFFTQVTTIQGCCHQFCLDCITKKIIEEDLHSCPVCNADLGCDPLQKLGCISTNSNDPKSTSEQERGKSLEKLSEPFGLQTGSENVAVSEQAPKRYGKGVASTSSKLQQSKEPAWDTKLQEQVAMVLATMGSKNPSAIVTVDNERPTSIWFALIASNKQKCRAPLPQIRAKYLRVKNENITVSCIRKYLVLKLNLSSENEVEISMQGRLIDPNMQIRELLDSGLHTTTPSKTKRVYVGSSAEDFVLTLTYCRKAS